MGYIGNVSPLTPESNVYPDIQFFSGNGVLTTFQLNRPVRSVASMIVVVNNVIQKPGDAFSINASNQIVFTSVPSAGSNNIYVIYQGVFNTVVSPPLGTGVVNEGNLAFNAVTETKIANGAVTATKIPNGSISKEKIDTLSSNGTGGLPIPLGTTAQRPSGTNTGTVRYNTTLQAIEFQTNSGSWIGIGVQDGSTFSNAALSAAAIKSLTGTTTDGFYWILIGGTPTQVWCDMNNDGGGWMLAMQTADNNSSWTYDDGLWTNTTLVNEGQPWNFSGHIKTRVYTTQSFTQIRMVAGRTLSNGLIENWSYSNMISLMSSGQNSGNSRTAWINWFTAGVGADPLLQPNCNQIGVNKAFNYMYVKLGITANNEGDCSTNDSGFGWGVRGISPYGNVNAFGAFSSSGRNNNYYGSIFVR
jgi:hypothetical protein